MSLISLDHVSKIYPRGTRPALDDVTLHIDRGEFVFLVGASGSGKTTLLSLMLREEEATDGEIHVAGHDLRRLSNRQVPQYRRSLGFIFQDYKLLDNKTVWQNVAFALEVIGTRRSTIRSLVPKVLETVGLTGKEHSYPQELSGGEQQRVTIARAYVNHPGILLADEPTGNLDPTTSLGIMEVLEAINRTGTTIVMATHNEEIVNSMRKRVVELHAGRIVRDERNGSYDSALYFPDAQVEARSQQAIGRARVIADVSASAGTPGPIAPAAQSDAASPRAESRDERERRAAMVVERVSQAVNADTADEGIARLASSVHSGRTGRYGEAFAPVETTLTWGKGLRLDEYEASLAADDPADASAAAGDAADAAAVPSPDAADASGESAVDAPSDAAPRDVSHDALDDGVADALDRAVRGAADDVSPADTAVPDVDLPSVADAADTADADDADGDMPGPVAAMPPMPPSPPMPPAPPEPPAPRAVDDHEGTDDTKGETRR